jgi:hypothetical protein
MMPRERCDNREVARAIGGRITLVGLAALAVMVGVAVAPRPVVAQRATSAVSPSRRDGGRPRVDTAFAAAVARLSEASGFFDTDNLISNEASYLHVVPRLRALGVTGGAYIGVGPDQNYSYLAVIRPRVAYLVDVRRDNLLQHLMFKALFARASSRIEFLCLWLGRALPPDPGAWGARPIDDIVRYVDGARRDEAGARQLQSLLVRDAVATGIPLSATDRATIERFAATFAREGLDLRFTSFGRAPRPYYPTLRDLVRARDTDGKQVSYLASEDDWRVVKAMHDTHRIIPVVGNLGGTHALPAIAREVAAARETVSALYTSNVEFYLWGERAFDDFARGVAAMPRDQRSVIIRSYFGRQFGDQHPLAVPGFASVQLLQPIDDFVRRYRGGGWTSYRALVTDGAR